MRLHSDQLCKRLWKSGLCSRRGRTESRGCLPRIFRDNLNFGPKNGDGFGRSGCTGGSGEGSRYDRDHIGGNVGSESSPDGDILDSRGNSGSGDVSPSGSVSGSVPGGGLFLPLSKLLMKQMGVNLLLPFDSNHCFSLHCFTGSHDLKRW